MLAAGDSRTAGEGISTAQGVQAPNGARVTVGLHSARTAHLSVIALEENNGWSLIQRSVYVHVCASE